MRSFPRIAVKVSVRLLLRRMTQQITLLGFLFVHTGFAFLPNSSKRQSLEINAADAFEWRKVTVEKEDNETANKWRIKELKSGAIYEVPRIYLMLIVDKPLMFVERIQRAVQLRSECENRLKFNAAVDGIILSEFPKPQQRLQDKIRKLLLFHSFNLRCIEIFESEHNILFQKTLAAMELITLLSKDPHSFPSIQLPTMEPRMKLRENKRWRHETFEETRKDFQRMWLYCCPEAIKIMEFINNECDDIRRMSLFHIQTDNVCNLMIFVDANNKKYSEISNFFETKWIEDVGREVKRQLVDSGKGWFELNVNDWGIYRMSKLPRLIELIKQRMEIAVFFMLRSSLQAFVNHLCQPCEVMLDIAVDFVWGNDLVTSWFPSPQPVFSMDLNFVNDDEPTYTTNIERFEIEIIEMFNSRILTSHRIPQIDPYLVAHLKFDKSLKLSSIGLMDKEIQKQIQHLRRCYQVSLIPLCAYAREYRRFIEFKNLNILDYVQCLRESNKTSKEMKMEILLQQKSIDEIELNVPSTIVIGPFQISVSALKQDLIVKHRDLFRQLLTMYEDKMKDKLAEIYDDFQKIILRLPKKFESIEELNSILEWIPDIPQEVNQIESKMKKLKSDFDVLESFFVMLSGDAMRLKVSSRFMPSRIQRRVEETQLKQEHELEQFRKLQAIHETEFCDQIENISVEVETYCSRQEIDDVSRFSCEIDELSVALNEMMSRGETLNKRQKIFNLPEIDMERLTVSVQRLHPHHKLWKTASNFLRSKDAWTLSPLSTIDINEVEAEVKRCENVLDDSRRHFASSAEMLVLIGNIFKDLDDFNKTFDVMKDLKNPDIEDEHWLLLFKQTGISMKEKEQPQEKAFDALVDQGILDYAQVVKEVSQKATHDREAERLEALDKERKRLEEDELNELKKARRAARLDI